MKGKIVLFTLVLAIVQSYFTLAQSKDSLLIRAIYNEILTNGQAYGNLYNLCKKVGHRISGSAQAAAAVELTKQIMSDYGFDSVWLQPVMVPRWVRGNTQKAFFAEIQSGNLTPLAVLALGGSVGTPAGGVTAEVVEVKRLDDLARLGKNSLEGKIVFFNRPMNPLHVSTFEAYRDAVDQRSSGAAEAAKYGAVAVLVRSMTLTTDDNPHTGATRYTEGVKAIPAAAVSTKAANTLSAALQRDPHLALTLSLDCKTLPDVLSYNVIGQLNGTAFPNEIITIGGHLDSWDVGEGAHDDGAGCVQSIEVLRTFKALQLKPKRTIRAVMFMNEENGLKGGLKYAEIAKNKAENHIAALESDAGGFTPRGFAAETNPKQWELLKKWMPLFEPYQIHILRKGGGGSDIGPLRELGTATIGLSPDTQRYFDYHHTQIDTFEAVNKRELEMGAATMAALVYLMTENGF